MPRFTLNTPLKSSFILPCAVLVLFPLSLLHSLASPTLPLSWDCPHARRVAEGAGEVIQSRISPSHPASWYSYHIVAPWDLPEYQLTKGLFPLSFQLWLSLLAPLLSFLHPFSTPSASLSTYFLLIPFYVVFLPLPLRDGRRKNTFFVFFQPLW